MAGNSHGIDGIFCPVEEDGGFDLWAAAVLMEL
jgi:hypothetical protein